MRILIALATLLLAGNAFAYDVTATMASTTGATSCQLYLGGTAAGAAKPCGAPQNYPNLITAAGTYQLAYRAVNAAGESGLSPITTVVIGAKPVDPTTPPGVTIVCTPAPCPNNIVITITP